MKKKEYDAFLIYPETCPYDYEDMIEFLGDLGYKMVISPLHNMEEEKEHYHCLLYNSTGKQRNTIVKELKDFGVTYVKYIYDPMQYIKYMNHETEEAIKDGKYHYKERPREINGGIQNEKKSSTFKTILEFAKENECYSIKKLITKAYEKDEKLAENILSLSTTQYNILKEIITY